MREVTVLQRARARAQRLRYADVMASLAMFVALGGTSYAVARLPKESVSSRELRDGSIRAVDLSKGAVPAGPRGPRGAEGSRGETGAKGDSGVGPTAEPWRPLPFAGGWANFGDGHTSGEFRRDQLGRIQLRGLVTRVHGSPGGDDLIATLPAGYRPAAKHLYAVYTCCAPGFGRVDVRPDGTVRWILGAAGETDATSLDGISYSDG